ncbi:hypothetical protein E5A73_15330 [Sphingomonas gei]|uniref:DUF6894 domain-containing protein n=1 Tax=Sphingomonas gei TaxID=1395960 RepID=A0A4S1X9T9_9SPHN|nr:hypothetical protein [Sphingomonas gei]TGX52177.1 hypothetical protein E5A73_15330 [Sphingomonas gei]
MTHYYLNIINGTGFVGDHEGEEFPDLAAARRKATESVRSILSDELKSAGLIDLKGRIEIADQQGSIVLTLPFREAVELRLDDSSGWEDA